MKIALMSALLKTAQVWDQKPSENKNQNWLGGAVARKDQGTDGWL